jgi:molecular chaperone DnaK
MAFGELSKAEAAIAEARAAATGENLAAIRKALDELQRASHALAQQLYKGSSGSSGSSGSGGSGGSSGSQGPGVKEGEVVDAEYVETR